MAGRVFLHGEFQQIISTCTPYLSLFYAEA
jgi:hypothetical protein